MRTSAIFLIRRAVMALGIFVACGVSMTPISAPGAEPVSIAGLGDLAEPDPWASHALIPWHFEAEASPLSIGGVDLGQVHWTTDRDLSLSQLSYLWGFKESSLTTLNPDLPHSGILPTGTRVRVYREDEARPTMSVGAPNRGRLLAGVPMPDGPYWNLRKSRHRVYGAKQTIRTLVGVLEAYGKRFEHAPPVSLGDISARNGRRISPHRSHQSGRDVDVAFVRSADTEYKRLTTADNFDAEKNWFIIKSLIDSGMVQSIFMSSRVQGWVREAARAELPETEVDRYFAAISHQHGHRHHMHVRFRCRADDRRCRTNSIPG
jgi:hypothetical protein